MSPFPYWQVAKRLKIDYGLVLRLAASLEHNTKGELQSMRYDEKQDMPVRWVAAIVLEERKRRERELLP